MYCEQLLNELRILLNGYQGLSSKAIINYLIREFEEVMPKNEECLWFLNHVVNEALKSVNEELEELEELRKLLMKYYHKLSNV